MSEHFIITVISEYFNEDLHFRVSEYAEEFFYIKLGGNNTFNKQLS